LDGEELIGYGDTINLSVKNLAPSTTTRIKKFNITSLKTNEKIMENFSFSFQFSVIHRNLFDFCLYLLFLSFLSEHIFQLEIIMSKSDGEKVISKKVANSPLETEKGSTQLSRYRRAYRRTQANWLPIALAVMFVVMIVLIIPVFRETDIHIQIGYADNITNVWVDTPNKPLISRLFQPSYPLGAYVLNITITAVGQTSVNFSRINVPIGEYVLVWQNGVPSSGLYTITVQLYKLQVLKDTYTINISF
jgi:hypothetical protein